MTEITLSLILGTALTLVFTFLPGLKDWYEKQDTAAKAQVMAFGLLIIGALVTAMSCGGLLSLVTCTKDGIVNFIVGSLINALIAVGPNQGIHQITKSLNKPATGVG